MTARWNTVWITGASSGIGLELARQMQTHGAKVAISARSSDKLSAIAAENDALCAAPLDVTDHAASLNTVAHIEDNIGPIDLAVLNAGLWSPMKVRELDRDAIEQAMQVNYMGVINALDALLPRMRMRGRGHIAIVASVAGYRGLPKSIAYGPTKAALINLAETLRAELSGSGITVSIINPGFVDTPMTRVNDFPMPGMISADKAADYMMKGLLRKQFEIAFPKRFAFVMKALRILPDSLFFFLAKRML